jgi:hypothetical protein
VGLARSLCVHEEGPFRTYAQCLLQREKLRAVSTEMQKAWCGLALISEAITSTDSGLTAISKRVALDRACWTMAMTTDGSHTKVQRTFRLHLLNLHIRHRCLELTNLH